MLKHYEVVVLGGGINGLSTLYHLIQAKVKRIALFERFSLFHPNGSSHGASRITRSAYADKVYVQLMQQVHQEEWPRFERDLEEKLILPKPAFVLGSLHGKFSRYLEAVQQTSAPVQQLSLAEGRRLFPHFRFQEHEGCLYDQSAGVVLAEKTLQGLVRYAKKQSVDLYENTPVETIHYDSFPLQLHTGSETITTDKLIVTAGAWVAELVPALKQHLSVIRQTMCYFRFPSQEDFAKLPIWIYLGETEQEFYYSLPESAQNRFKFAHHETAGRIDVPDPLLNIPNKEKIVQLNTFLGKRMIPAWTFESAETCLYTLTKTEDFILDRHPHCPHITIGAGFSGHGFKFGPLTGKILTELALFGKTQIAGFEQNRSRFSFILEQANDSSRIP